MENRIYAHKYLEFGWSIIPIVQGDKRPYINWKEYQERKPTREEIDSWFDQWPDAGIALVTGSISGIVVFDIDSQEGISAVHERGGFPQTPRSKTGGGGLHIFLKHPQTGNLKNFVKRLPGLDFRGDGGYVVIPPSLHPSGNQYAWDVSPFECGCAEMSEWMLDLFTKTSEPSVLQQKAVHTGESADIPDGVKEGMRNVMAARLAGRHLGQGISKEEVLKILREWNMRNQPPLDDEELTTVVESIAKAEAHQNCSAFEDVVNYLNSLPENMDIVAKDRELQQIQDSLIKLDDGQLTLLHNEKLLKKVGLRINDVVRMRQKLPADDDEPNYIAVFNGLVDIVDRDGELAFLVIEDGRISITDHVVINDVRYVPPPSDQLPWLVPRASEVTRHFESDNPVKLFDDLVNYHRSISQLPDDKWYYFMAAYVMHTYLIEKMEYTPVLCLFALPERGKSRTGKGIVYAAYRGVHLESLNEPHIIRLAENLNATIFFDVMDLWKKALKSGSEDILLQRFERGAKVPRIKYPERDRFKDTVYYDIFGPTIIGTNEPVHHILETRAIMINMPEVDTRNMSEGMGNIEKEDRKFDEIIKKGMGLPFKDRLTAFRARFMNVNLPDIPKPAFGRLGDIMRPIVQIVGMVRPEAETILHGLIKEIENKRLIEKSVSIEAQLLITILHLERQAWNGLLLIRSIVELFNEGKPEKDKRTDRFLGRLLSAMGFDKRRGGPNGETAVVWDDKKIAQLIERFGLQELAKSIRHGYDNETVTGQAHWRADPHPAGLQPVEINYY